MLASATISAAPRILKALCLPTQGCTSLTVSFNPGEMVKAKAEYLVPEEGLQALQELAPGMVLEVKVTTTASPEASQGRANPETQKG
jgi:hypothetical protein